MLGDIIRTAMGFAGILAAGAQIKQPWLPAWGRPGLFSAVVGLGGRHGGFCPSELV